jgi:predicted thioesterase
MPLAPGQTAEVQRVVTRDLIADVLGNPGVTVLATPVVPTLLENAAHAVMTVLLETDGRRCLFDVEAWDEVEKIAEGRHERYVVADLARFLARASAKRRGRG